MLHLSYACCVLRTIKLQPLLRTIRVASYVANEEPWLLSRLSTLVVAYIIVTYEPWPLPCVQAMDIVTSKSLTILPSALAQQPQLLANYIA